MQAVGIVSRFSLRSPLGLGLSAQRLCCRFLSAVDHDR